MVIERAAKILGAEVVELRFVSIAEDHRNTVGLISRESVSDL